MIEQEILEHTIMTFLWILWISCAIPVVIGSAIDTYKNW